MNTTGKYIILCGIIACFIIGCTKPYNPKVIATPSNYLVVEGTINTGGDSTKILLSRTVPLTSTLNSIPELGATVTIQSNQNQSYPLTTTGNGIYTSPALTLPSTAQYRLSIVTSDGKAYLSDYVSPVATPPIDSVGFNEVSNAQEGAGMQVYVNTHDPNNNTHYYRWDYAETWEFTAEYSSLYISNGTSIVPRQSSQQVYQCWASGLSTDINLGSSAKLTQDVIYQAPITFVPSNSEKLEIRYSVLVTQYALTAAAYNYFSILKENTESLGSIFDAQPSQLTGNVHCTTDPTLPVIGYVTAGTVQQKRIYVNNSQLPKTWVAYYPYNCLLDTALYNDHSLNEVAAILLPLPSSFVETVGVYPPGGPIIGYQYVDRDCGDCTIRGTNVKPSFWQ